MPQLRQKLRAGTHLGIPCFLVLLLLLFSSSAVSDQSVTKKDVVDYARAIDVSRLDPVLSPERLDEWLSDGPAHLETVNWQMSDCEINVNPADLQPLCAKLDFKRGPSVGYAMIIIGTFRDGITGTPRLNYIFTTADVSTPHGTSVSDKLSDLPILLYEADFGGNEPFKIEIKADAPVVKSGSAVIVNGSLTNTSNQSIDTSGCYCGPSGLDSYLNWSVFKLEEPLVTERVYQHPELATGSAILNRILKPGDSLAADQQINRLYDMTHPGEYFIRASRRISNREGAPSVESNLITVTVTP
jgi:hypothetical protein